MHPNLRFQVVIIAFQQWLRHKRLTKAMKTNLDKLGPTPGRDSDVDLEADNVGEINVAQQVSVPVHIRG